jgi:hypothetical protein
VEAEDPLSQLADIHLPQDVAFWPPAPGWWLLAALLLAALAWFAWRRFRQWQESQRLRHALAELRTVLATFSAVEDEAARNRAGLTLLYQINSLLKRVALARHPGSGVAALTGRAWLDWLDAHGGGGAFANGPGQVLAEGEYRPRFDADAEALAALVRQWIEVQYREPVVPARVEVAA